MPLASVTGFQMSKQAHLLRNIPSHLLTSMVWLPILLIRVQSCDFICLTGCFCTAGLVLLHLCHHHENVLGVGHQSQEEEIHGALLSYHSPEL